MVAARGLATGAIAHDSSPAPTILAGDCAMLGALPASPHPILADAEIGVGLVTLRDGVAYLGERRLADPAQAALAEACAALQEALP